jgi:hypothetical protein
MGVFEVSYRKGEMTKGAVDRNYPHQVELRADLTTGKNFDLAQEFCRDRSLAPRATARRPWVMLEADMADPFTIHIFVPDGDPEGLRFIDRMNWTGLGIVFPRTDWPKIRQRSDFSKPGVYILIGYVSDDDDPLPTLYIGQGDVVRARLESHVQNKDFWSQAVVFVSSAIGGLNRAHATWLEHALIRRS